MMIDPSKPTIEIGEITVLPADDPTPSSATFRLIKRSDIYLNGDTYALDLVLHEDEKLP